MKYLILFFLIVIGFLGCSNDSNEQWNEIDFSFDNAWDQSVSIKLNNRGNAYMAKGRVNRTYYKCSISDSLMTIINQKTEVVLRDTSLKSIYTESGEDLSHYNLILRLKKRDDLKFIVEVRTEPKVLSSLKENLLLIGENKNILKIDSVITFGSIKGFYPPLPPPRQKFH